jgi:hypothetical protein
MGVVTTVGVWVMSDPTGEDTSTFQNDNGVLSEKQLTKPYVPHSSALETVQRGVDRFLFNKLKSSSSSNYIVWNPGC